MSLALKIGVVTGSTADHRQGRIIVQGHVTNLGDRPERLSISHIQYYLQGPAGPTEVRNEATYNIWEETEVPPNATQTFEAELVAYAPPEIQPGGIYTLTARLPNGGDVDASLLKFRQLYLSPISVTPVGGVAAQ